VTGDRHGPAVRLEQRREDPDRGRFAGTIGPEERQNGSLRHGEVNILNGTRLPERLRSSMCFDDEGATVSRSLSHPVDFVGLSL
jgi:hypothetical protein